MVLDTPGFSLLDSAVFDPVELQESYPEFAGLDDKCRFGCDCLHQGEPGCAAKELELPQGRMQRYGELLTEARQRWKNRY